MFQSIFLSQFLGSCSERALCIIIIWHFVKDILLPFYWFNIGDFIVCYYGVNNTMSNRRVCVYTKEIILLPIAKVRKTFSIKLPILVHNGI